MGDWAKAQWPALRWEEQRYWVQTDTPEGGEPAVYYTNERPGRGEWERMRQTALTSRWNNQEYGIALTMPESMFTLEYASVLKDMADHMVTAVAEAISNAQNPPPDEEE